MAGNENTEKVWKALKNASHCMLVTHDGETIRARPMAIYAQPSAKAIYLLTDVRNHKDEEIADNPQVCVTLDEETFFCSVSGAAQISRDRVIIDDIWDTSAAAWFDGKDDPNLRLLTTGGLPDAGAPGKVWRQVSGGFLIQDRDNGRLDGGTLRTVTDREPTPGEMADMLFAWRVAKHVKSNAIVYARDGRTVGIGAGQMSRVDSARIAARKAEDMGHDLGLHEPPTRGSALASDAFFPFADGLQAAVEAGATAVIQPGGSRRDDEVIAAANAAGIAMVFTGMRHFRH